MGQKRAPVQVTLFVLFEAAQIGQTVNMTSPLCFVPGLIPSSHDDQPHPCFGPAQVPLPVTGASSCHDCHFQSTLQLLVTSGASSHRYRVLSLVPHLVTVQFPVTSAAFPLVLAT